MARKTGLSLVAIITDLAGKKQVKSLKKAGKNKKTAGESGFRPSGQGSIREHHDPAGISLALAQGHQPLGPAEELLLGTGILGIADDP